jgi:hypothetical protein
MSPPVVMGFSRVQDTPLDAPIQFVPGASGLWSYGPPGPPRPRTWSGTDYDRAFSYPSQQGSLTPFGERVLDGYIEGNITTPNGPARRKVHLFREQALTGQPGIHGFGRLTWIDWQWSDPQTGHYRFEPLYLAGTYTLMAFDHTGGFDPVVMAGVYATTIYPWGHFRGPAEPDAEPNPAP